MGAVDTEEPIAMCMRSRRQATPVPPAVQDEPFARRTRSLLQGQANIFTLAMAAAICYPANIFQSLAMPVLDKETGKILEYSKLRKDPGYAPIWNPSFSNELGRLCQGVGKGTKGPKKYRVAGTDMFRVMHYHDIPKYKLKDVCHTMLVCEYRPQKEDPNRTHITVAGGHIKYPGDLGTPTGSLELVKIIINSVLSRCNARFVCFDAANFYLQTLMANPEYVRIKLSAIPQEIIDEYNLTKYVHNCWIYYEILRGCYGLPQSGRLANDLLRTRLEKAGYYEAATTPGLWRHTWHPRTIS